MILAKLEEPVSMSFNEDTPLEDVLKYIKQATTTSTYWGIPIYVDPLGLQEAEKSMTSTVRNMDLEGVPLRRTLQLVLEQIDLNILSKMECSTSRRRIRGHHSPAGNARTIATHLKTEKAERGELTLSNWRSLSGNEKQRCARKIAGSPT